jgi:hypothetical protein
MEVRTLPAMHGWMWVMHGFALFRTHPAVWLLTLLFYWLCLLVASVPPLVGPLVASALIPGLSAGFMVACAAAQKRELPLPTLLIAPFRANAQPQLWLGAAYIGALALVLGIVALLDGGVLFKVMLLGAGLPVDATRTPGFMAGSLVAVLLYAPVMLAFWFAPALCLWHGMRPGKALFFSFFAGVRNTRAFLVYGLGWALFAVVVPALLALVMGLFLPKRQESMALVALVLTPYMLAMMCSMICSFYSSYIAIFGPQPEPLPAA